MDSMRAPPELASEDRSLCLPVNCTTVTAEDVRVRLVLSFDLDERTDVDASAVANIGQAGLQLLLAARAESDRVGQPFSVTNPSAAFIDRVNKCCLASAIGVVLEKDIAS